MEIKMDQLFSNKSNISPFSPKIPHITLLFVKGCLNALSYRLRQVEKKMK